MENLPYSRYTTTPTTTNNKSCRTSRGGWRTTTIVLATLSVLLHKRCFTTTVSAFTLPQLVLPLTAQCHQQQSKNEFALFSSSSSSSSSTSGEGETESLLEKATRLRQEASDMEVELRVGRSAAETTTTTTKQQQSTRQQQQPIKVISYTDLKDSVWELSYRFSDQPETSNDNSEETEPKKREFVSGKVTLYFKADGFTDLVRHTPQQQGGTAAGTTNILKVWGWDLEEQSSEDEKDYLLFSLDAQLPKKSSQRYYFQARQEKDNNNNNVISLKEGTVTIKQDLVDAKKTPGMWGLFFSPRGILAQFRYVGDFVAKPTSRFEE